MHFEILVEEPSAEAALQILMPKMIGSDPTFKIHPHSGKQSLFAKLSGRLQGYAGWLPDDWRLVVLVDRDADDCAALKQQLEGAAAGARLLTRSTAKAAERIQVVNRIAIEELEAWFFGDPAAITAAFPRVSSHLGKRAKYKDPDAIKGGTWEALERVLQKAGYYKAGLAKIEAARRIALHMDPERNVSHSFQVFCDSLRALLSGEKA